MAVPVGKENLRVTIAWDDCAGIDGLYTATNFSASKLCNDLDLYLISPSGKFYFPWRIDPLPIEKIDLSGNAVPWSSDTFGIERIKESDMPKAERYCGKNDAVLNECFDHLNNVEVVDVENPEQGTWQVVVRGTAVREGKVNGDAQLVSIVSDFTLTDSSCQIMHPYKAQDHLECEYALGDNLEAFVTFDKKTFVETGDTITLSDGSGKILGKYAGNALAGKRIRMKSSKLKVELESDNDSSQGYGFEIRRIEKVPFSIAPLFLPAIKSRRR